MKNLFHNLKLRSTKYNMATFTLSSIKDKPLRDLAASIDAISDQWQKYQADAADIQAFIVGRDNAMLRAQRTVHDSPSREAFAEYAGLKAEVAALHEANHSGLTWNHLQWFGAGEDNPGAIYGLNPSLKKDLAAFAARLKEVVKPILEASKEVDAKHSADLETAEPIRSKLTQELESIMRASDTPSWGTVAPLAKALLGK